MKVVFSFGLALCLTFLATASCQQIIKDPKSRLNVPREEAKSLLRVKRGWGSFRKKINPFEGRSEREEADERHRAQVAAERHNEAVALQQRRERECPPFCWTVWSPLSNCSQPCGSGGFKARTRRVKTPAELGWLCRDFIAARGCVGATQETYACNRQCANGGALIPTGCTCTAGWTDQCCDKRITCPDPGKPANGLTTPSGSGLHFGTTVKFSCNEGYELQGSASSSCVGTGTWTNKPPTCQVISCGDPGTPSNSNLEVVSGTQFNYGTTIRVSCKHGYSLSGDAVRRCELDGKWAGTAPTCTQIVCSDEPAPANGQVVYPSGRTLDAEAKYTCSSGFVLQGTPTRKCMSSGRWTGQAPSCLEIQCNDLSNPEFGLVVHTNSNGGKTSFGGIATFTCNEGYTLRGAQKLTCGGTSVDGTWSGRPPVCEAVNCGDPGSPTHGARSGNVFTFGSTISFSCSAGYFLRGGASAVCQASGQWSTPKAECVVCAVNQYKEGTNAKSACDACPPHSTTNGAGAVTAKIYCVCSEGYKGPSGGPCEQITCPPLPTPANSIKKTCRNAYHDTCEFECKPGHVLSSGNHLRTCNENGWTGRDMVCSACPVNTYKSSQSQCLACPENSGTKTTGNEKSGCKCNQGWGGPAGGPCSDVNECLKNNGNCSQTCINEVGTYRCECAGAGYVKDRDDPTKCNAANQCPRMQVPANGGLVCHSHKPTNTERCQVKCNKGFEHIVSPNAFEECGPTTNWQWNHVIQGKPILDCVAAFFEEVIIELDVFYFTDQCSGLTNIQELTIAREFVQYLNSKGVCIVGGKQVCGVSDVTIECAPASRKRSLRQKLIIKFSIKSQVEPTTENCDASCRSSFMTQAKAKMETATQQVQDVFQNSMVRPTGSPEAPSVSFGGISLTPLEIKRVSLNTVCAKGMVRKDSICVACPSGSYSVTDSNHCMLCPAGSYQNNAGQTICLPCRTATIPGSKTC